VNRLSMFITPEGEWVFEGSAEFLTALGDPEPNYDSVRFAVTNLGFIRFCTFEDAVTEIELHPRNVELAALLSVQQQLLSQPVKLIRIKYFDNEWHSEIIASREQAIARLAELCSATCAPGATDRFTSETKDLSQLFDDPANSFRPLVQKWRMSLGYFDPSVVSFAIAHQLLSRMMIIGVRPKGDAVFRFIGDGFYWTDDEYQYYAIGEKTENQPDKEYGGWVTEFYKAVASSSDPRYETITASLPLPRLRRANADPVRYERLLLPWRTRSEEIFVTMSSKVVSQGGSGVLSDATPVSSAAKKLAKSS
jgi:hypothetical protein